MNLWPDRVALVSSSTRGVGAGIVRLAVHQGARAALTGRRPDTGTDLDEELGSDAALYVQAEPTEAGQALGSVRQVISHISRVDCRVNAAGLTMRETLLDISPQPSDQQIAVNSPAPSTTMEADIPDTVTREVAGTKANICSWTVQGGQPDLSPDSAAGPARSDSPATERPRTGGPLSHQRGEPRPEVGREGKTFHFSAASTTPITGLAEAARMLSTRRPGRVGAR
jgi:NAD(P)-dependent dehydrogenase (short-subunit alcohol dehydrogenase family)